MAAITGMHPDLQRALAAIDETTHAFTDADWVADRHGHWSRAAVLEHLGKAYRGTASMLDRCVAEGAARGSAPGWRQRLIAWLIIDVGYFPTAAKAPAVTVPEGLPGPDALAFAEDALLAFDRAAVRCAAAFDPDVRVASHPLLGGFTVDQWRRFHWRHTRHHMRQITRRR